MHVNITMMINICNVGIYLVSIWCNVCESF